MALDPSATPFDRMAVVELLRADPTASIAGLVKLDLDEVLAGRYFEQHSLLQSSREGWPASSATIWNLSRSSRSPLTTTG